MATPPPTQPPLMINVNGYTGPERRNEFRLWRDSVDQRLDSGNHTMKGLRLDLDANTQATNALKAEMDANTKAINAVKADTSEVVDLLHSFKGAFKVFDLVGKLAKPLGAIIMLGVAIAGFFTALKGGGHIK